MITYAILCWVCLQLGAPRWCYVLLGVGTAVKCVNFGLKLKK